MPIADESYQVPRCPPRWGAWPRQLSYSSQCSTIAEEGQPNTDLAVKDFRDISNSTWDFDKGPTAAPQMKEGKQPADNQFIFYAKPSQTAPQTPRHSCPAKMGIDQVTIDGLHEVWGKVYNPESGRGLTFPETVHSLADLGVNRYRVDFITSTATAYIKGDACVYHFPSYATETLTPGTIAWSLEKLRTAIKKARADAANATPDLPNYTKQIIEAGVVDYTCFIEGRRVTYSGYLGEMYSAWFMGAGADAPLNTGLSRRNTVATGPMR